MPKLKIGVFDSGVGGLSVVNAIQKAMPDLEIIYKDDKEHVPYGTKSAEEIHGFIRPIFQDFIKEGCAVVVIACNTVTTNLIEGLRNEYPIPMVGMEPAVKQAAEMTQTKTIAVCATPRTLSSKRYQWLKQEYAKGIRILEPDCSDWASMIENNSIERDKVAKRIEAVINQNADVIVLGCTHYHWIEGLIRSISTGKAEVIQPEQPVIRQLKTVLSQLV